MIADDPAQPLLPAPWPARIVASLVDLLVILVWLLLVTGFGLVLTPFLAGSSVPGLLLTDVIAFCFTVLPTGLYLTLTEVAPAAGTLGKRMRRLAVQTAPSRARVTSIAVRNAIKLVPWQLAHFAVSRFILDDQFQVALACYGASVMLVITTIALAARDPERRALHDRLAGTRVVALGP